MENKVRSGFVNIVGLPNAGKSTLMNQLLGERLSIITHKAQTTRHRIHGIYNQDDFQIIFSDTPGIIEPKYKMQEGMMSFVKEALSDADLFLVVVDVTMKEVLSEQILKKLSGDTPVFIVLNKMDLIDQTKLESMVDQWHERLPKAKILPVSAKEGFHTEVLMEGIKQCIPTHPRYFDEESISDRPVRFFVSEIIREKILMLYEQEIPYSCQVEVTAFKEFEDAIDIECTIYVSRDSQKGILVGKQGAAIKQLGIHSRKSLEKFLDKRVRLQTWVKVNKDWRDNEDQLRNYGYIN